MTDGVGVPFEEAFLLELKIFGVELVLSNKLILTTDEKNSVLLSDDVAAVGDIAPLIGLNGLMLDYVHVILQAHYRGVSLQGSQDYVLPVVEEITREDHRFRFYIDIYNVMMLTVID